MELTNKELNVIINTHTEIGENKGYTIYLGGHQFVSDRRKRVFAKRHHAMLSLRNSIEYTIKGLVRSRLSGMGVLTHDIPKYSDYRDAWDNFLKQATESGFLKVVELN